MSKSQTTHPNDAGRFKAVYTGEGENFSMVAYKAGQVFSHWYWGNVAFEVGSMSMRKEKIPALVDHETNKVCGVISGFNKSGQAEFTGKFIDNENSKYVKSLREVGQECSLRFDMEKVIIEEIPEGKSAQVDGFSIAGPVVVLKQCEIMEVSFTTFGAVPDTKTSFSTSHFRQEKTMAETPTPADVRASVEKELKAKFSKFSEISGCKEFAMECFNADLSMEAFSEKLIGRLKTQVAELSAKNTELAAQLAQKPASAPQPASFSGAQEPAKADLPKSYLEAVSAFKAQGKPVAEAISMAVKTYPDLYKSFLGGK